ncbi:MAG: hypothetical protein RL708_1300 [Bacteroidota bacterium]|jgi:gliding motility-associated-like protein
MKFFTKKLLLVFVFLVSTFTIHKASAQVVSANFNFSPSVICLGVPVNYNSSSVGTKIASYVWSFGSNASLTSFTGQIPPSIIYSTTGLKTISLVVTDSLGNSATSTKSILVQSATANAGLDISICSSSSASIGSNALSGYTYNWTPTLGLSSATSAKPIANPATTTTYTLTANSPNGCSAIDQVIVTNIGVIKADAGKDVSVCEGLSISIGSASVSGFNYSWLPTKGLSSLAISNPIATVTATTTYIVTVTGGGCTDLDTIVVTSLQNPTVQLNDTIHKCLGSSIPIGTSPVLGLNYSWLPTTSLSSASNSNPSSSSTIDRLYTLTVTNASNCSSAASVFVDVFDPIKSFAGLDQVVCNGNGIVLGGSPIVASGGTGNYIYSWQPTATLSRANIDHPIATPTITTTYILTVTDFAGTACGSSNDTIVLTILPLPHPVINMPTVFCEGASPIAMSGTPSGGFFSGAGIIFGTTFDPSDTSIILGTPYPITYTYSSGVCIYDTAISVVVFANPIADAGIDKTICKNFGQSSTSLIATGGTGFIWSPSTGLSAINAASVIASPTTNTTYTVAVTLNGCTSYDSVVVSLSINCGVDSILIAYDDYVQVPSNVSSVINYLGNDDLINNQIPRFTIIQLNSTKGGSATINSNHILTYTPPVNYIGMDTLIYQICDSASAATVSNPYLCDTAYVFIAIAPNTVDDNYLVKCNDSLYFSPLSNDNYGNGNYPVSLNLLLLPSNGTLTLNNNIAHYVPNIGFTGYDTATYVVCVNGLCSFATIYIHVSCETLPIAVDDYITVKNNQSNNITMLNNDTTNGAVTVQVITNPMHGTYVYDAVTQQIIYTPSAFYVGNDKIQYVICNQSGCDTAWIYLAIEDNSPCQLSSGFSPNGDGVNDLYIINCTNHYPDARITIFNRWGNVIYSRKGNTSNSNAWDGQYNGVDLPDGTYYYVFELNANDTKPKTGFIELKR